MPAHPETSPARDKLFAETSDEARDFDFGENTARVFDDMLDRSIPQYHELQRMIGELAGEFARPGTQVVDLGCSTGITLQTLRSRVPADCKLVGIDYSRPMLDLAAERLRSGLGAPYELIENDLNKGVTMGNASVAVLNLTLQFIRPLHREGLVRQIREGLIEHGALILVEKVVGEHSMLNRLFIKLYYDMKMRNGYSGMEIAQKREALENVLVPYRMEENMELLRRCGFPQVEVFFKWYNFCGFLAVKGS
jgi:tRNA (cmo5U34)-methyltransferase